MKLPLFTCVCLIAGFYSTNLQAQNSSPCVNPKVHSNVLMMNEAAEKIGFKLVNFYSLQSVNNEYVGVTVNLDSGYVYQFNFAATPGFKNFEYRIANKTHDELVVKKIKNKESIPDYFRENIVANYTGIYFILVKQKIATETNACIGVSVLKNQK